MICTSHSSSMELFFLHLLKMRFLIFAWLFIIIYFWPIRKIYLLLIVSVSDSSIAWYLIKLVTMSSPPNLTNYKIVTGRRKGSILYKSNSFLYGKVKTTPTTLYLFCQLRKSLGCSASASIRDSKQHSAGIKTS